MDETRKYFLLLAATILAAHKLATFDDRALLAPRHASQTQLLGRNLSCGRSMRGGRSQRAQPGHTAGS